MVVDQGRISEEKARHLFCQLVEAVSYLHKMSIVHRDLKLENIVLNENHQRLVIVDFGMGRFWSGDKMAATHCGSPEYAAPELFDKIRSFGGREVDVWSLGIVLILYDGRVSSIFYRWRHQQTYQGHQSRIH